MHRDRHRSRSASQIRNAITATIMTSGRANRIALAGRTVGGYGLDQHPRGNAHKRRETQHGGPAGFRRKLRQSMRKHQRRQPIRQHAEPEPQRIDAEKFADGWITRGRGAGASIVTYIDGPRVNHVDG